MPVCITCGIEKDTSEFYIHDAQTGKLRGRCKECMNNESKEYTTSKKEKIAEYQKQYRLLNKDTLALKRREYYQQKIDQVKEYKKEYYKENSEKVRKKVKEYAVINPGKIKDRGIRYRIENKETIAKRKYEYSITPQGKLTKARDYHRRKGYKKQTECTLTVDQWNKIISGQDNKCIGCGKAFTKRNVPTRDHIMPLSKGGGLTFENIQALCRSCNSKKCNRLDKSKIVTWLN